MQYIPSTLLLCSYWFLLCYSLPWSHHQKQHCERWDKLQTKRLFSNQSNIRFCLKDKSHFISCPVCLFRIRHDGSLRSDSDSALLCGGCSCRAFCLQHPPRLHRVQRHPADTEHQVRSSLTAFLLFLCLLCTPGFKVVLGSILAADHAPNMHLLLRDRIFCN